MEIAKYDVNFRNTALAENVELRWMDIREDPFQIYGLYQPRTEDHLHRLPTELAARVSENVAAVENHPSGGRVRFSTNASYIALRATFPRFDITSCMPISGACGFDLYLTDNDRFVFLRHFAPTAEDKQGFASAVDLVRFELGEGWHDYCINFPLFNRLTAVQIGIPSDCQVKGGGSYRPLKPIVYYGSSVTQGGCASRPGNCYTNIVSRRLNMDFINLGFSGSAKGEQIVADYIAGLDMSVFVYDYGYNAPTVEHLQRTHYPFYETIRAKNPDLPILMISRIDSPSLNDTTPGMRAAVRESYERALAAGDKNVYHIDGGDLFAGPERWDCTVDAVHPNDLGFRRMADVIGAELARILGLPLNIG